ncbi:MAG: DMT family transporter [Rhodospirillales bacterium]|jgi:drug/metabolite transporter (DMT)-like permease
MDARTRMDGTAWALLLTLAMLWGGSFFFAKVAVAEVPPLTVVLVRVALAALVLVPVLHLAGGRLPGRADVWRAAFVMAAINNVIPFALFFWASVHVTSGLAAILNATTPLSGVVIAHFLTDDEKATPARLAGVALGLAGVAVLVGPSALGIVDVALLPQLACLAAAISYAFAGVYGRRFRAMGVMPLRTATLQVTASTVLMIPIAATVDRPWTLAVPSAKVLWALVGLAVLCTAVGYLLYFEILKRAGATNLLLVTFLVPVSALLLGGLFLGEAVSGGQAWGMALIGLGLACVDGRLLTRRQ